MVGADPTEDLDVGTGPVVGMDVDAADHLGALRGSSAQRTDIPAGSTVVRTGRAPDEPVPFVLALLLLLSGLLVGVLLVWWLGLLLGALVLARDRDTLPGHDRAGRDPRARAARGLAAAGRSGRHDHTGRGVPRPAAGLRRMGTADRARHRDHGRGLPRWTGARVHRTDDTRIVVNLLEAAEAAAVVNALMDGRASSGGPPTTSEA